MLFQLTTWPRDLRLSYTALSEEDSLFQKTVAVIETSIWCQLFNGPQRKRAHASIDHQSLEFLFRWSVSEPVSAWLQAIHSAQNELVWASTRRILSRRIGALLCCTDPTYAYTWFSSFEPISFYFLYKSWLFIEINQIQFKMTSIRSDARNSYISCVPGFLRWKDVCVLI